MSKSTILRGLAGAAAALSLVLVAGCASEEEKALDAVAEAQEALDAYDEAEYRPAREQNQADLQALAEEESEAIAALGVERDEAIEQAELKAEAELTPLQEEYDAEMDQARKDIEERWRQSRTEQMALSATDFEGRRAAGRAAREYEETRRAEVRDEYGPRIEALEAERDEAVLAAREAYTNAESETRTEFKERANQIRAELEPYSQERTRLSQALEEAEEHAFMVQLGRQ